MLLELVLKENSSPVLKQTNKHAKAFKEKKNQEWQNGNMRQLEVF